MSVLACPNCGQYVTDQDLDDNECPRCGYNLWDLRHPDDERSR